MTRSAVLRAFPALACLALSAPIATADPRADIAPPAHYSVVKDDRGVWWLQSPDGSRFYSLGINNVTPEPYMPRPGTTFYNPVPTEFKGDTKAWASSVTKLLLENNFNTLGAWSSAQIPAGERLHTTPVLYVVEYEGTRCLSPLRPDFEEYVRANVRTALAKIPNRAGLIGVFLDNEMPWYGKSGWDDISTYTLLEQAFELPDTDIRRIAARDFLKSRYASPAAFAAAYHRDLSSWSDLKVATLTACSSPEAMADREKFTAMLADRFFEVTTRIVREELPGVLILGTRIPGNAPDSVIRACGRHCDVVSLNQYNSDPKPDENTLTRFWVLGGKPIMHTEFSWRARQNNSKNPNTRGAGTIVETQADRAAAYSSLVADIATVPYVIGSCWFEFADQSPQGRFDGEDSNYGVVDIHNKPYTELLSAMRSTNAQVRDLHAKSTRVMPSELPKIKPITFTPGQHPERAPTLNLLAEWTHEPEIWGAPDATLSWKRDSTNLVLSYNTGAQYGAGINIFGPKTSALSRGPANSTDLDGYSTIVLEATAPKGVQLNIVLAEAGAASSSSAKFDTFAGDDGEGYISPPIYGTGELTTIRIPIADFLKQKFFGNQHGSSRIDMQAIRVTGIQVSGDPRLGEVVVRSYRLEK
jgi:agarase